MSYISSLPRGIFRKDNAKFVPTSMIDTLFDYGNFLSRADAAGAIASGLETRKNIVIIGAGAAGLAAAYELAKVKNVYVTVFEPKRKIGGRMDSIFISDEAYNNKVFEMGCMRFPPTSAALFHYLKKAGLSPVGQFPDPGKVDTALLYENKVINWPAGSSAPNNADFQRIGGDFGSMLTHILGNVNKPNINNPSKLFDFWAIYQIDPTANNKQNVINSWQSIINTYKDLSYYTAVYALSQDTAIVERPWTQEDMNKFGALGVGSGGFGPLYAVNFLEILRLFANGWEDNQQFLEEGIDTFAQFFDRDEPNVDYQTVVRIAKIIKENDQYELVVVNGIKVAPKFDAVIVATTTRAMEYMGLTVDGVTTSSGTLTDSILQQGPKVAIRNLHLMNSSKLFVSTTTKFWYKENNSTGQDLPANMQTDELMRGLYCLDYDIDKADPSKRNPYGKGVVLISYVWGDDSSKLLVLTPEKRYQQFLLAIQKINPTFARLLEEQTEEMRCIDWENEIDHYGAFKLNYPGQEQANHDAFYQFQNQNQGVFLAGDSVSWAGGWLEGALTTGINAACAAAAHVGASVIADSPLDSIPSHMYDYSHPFAKSTQ